MLTRGEWAASHLVSAAALELGHLDSTNFAHFKGTTFSEGLSIVGGENSCS